MEVLPCTDISCLAVRELMDAEVSRAGVRVARRKSAEYKSSFCRLNKTGLVEGIP